MSTTRKIWIGVGLASGALLATWLLTGSRRQKTKKMVRQGARSLNLSLRKPEVKKVEESEADYYA